ncbi:MAG: DNA methyltransferase [Acidimicrobiia bacterium]
MTPSTTLTALNRIPEFAQRYAGQVRLVYIDPPFNTGQAFPNYDDNLEHSVWLSMLRDRLLQIKPLLSAQRQHLGPPR